MVIHTSEVHKAVRHTRQFWLDAQPEFSPVIAQLIEAYAAKATLMPFIDMPPRALFISTILSIGDSAAGFDGVCFAFLHLFFEKAADLFIKLLQQIFQSPQLVRLPNLSIGLDFQRRGWITSG